MRKRNLLAYSCGQMQGRADAHVRHGNFDVGAFSRPWNGLWFLPRTEEVNFFDGFRGGKAEDHRETISDFFVR